jgi:DNA ligase-1
VNFLRIAEVFEQMTSTTKRNELSTILAGLLKECGSDLRIVSYFVQGKLAPDFEGIETGMSDKLIIRGLSKVSGMTEKDVMELFVKEGDLGSVAESIARIKKQKGLFGSELTASYVYEVLRKIAGSAGEGSIKARTDMYTDLIMNSSPLEAKYITRIISGKLRLGVSDSTILSSLVEAFYDKEKFSEVEEAYNFYPDMGRIADLLRSGNYQELASTGPSLMVPCKVMLAERLPTVEDILEKMGGRAAFEYKYDGMRVQIHKRKKIVRIFSRGTEETTTNFPDIVKAAGESFADVDCILDGEAVPFNPETGELYPFQVVSQRRGRKYNLEKMEEEIPLAVFLFDVLYLNEESLVKRSYPERRKILESIVKEDDHFRLATSLVSDNPEEINRFFEKAIEDGCEGVVAKNITEDSVYRAGARGWLWIKMKRDYQAELSDSLDLVVIGAFNGHGRRKGTYGALLLACYNHDTDAFESTCKLGTGFKDDVLFSLPNKFESLIVKEKPARVVSSMIPDSWIYPRVVMEVVGAEITISPVHSCAFGKISPNAGLALRFPRFSGRWREDKKPEDATSTIEIIEMYNNQKKSMTRS